jgi:hypothetical protein
MARHPRRSWIRCLCHDLEPNAHSRDLLIDSILGPWPEFVLGRRFRGLAATQMER